MPRPISSVHTSTHTLPSRKSLTTLSRSCWFRSECMTSMLMPSNINSLYSCWARSYWEISFFLFCQRIYFDEISLKLTLLSTNTRTGGCNPFRSISLNASNLPASLPTKTSSCSTKSVAAFLWPMVIVRKPLRFFRHHLATAFVQVALNKPTLIDGLEHSLYIWSNCSRNPFLPSSNNLSASSSISHFTL